MDVPAGADAVRAEPAVGSPSFEAEFFKARTAGVLQEAFVQSGLTLEELAARLMTSKGAVRYLLSCQGEFTLGTLTAVGSALGARFVLRVES